jgi:hypothetical protein
MTVPIVAGPVVPVIVPGTRVVPVVPTATVRVAVLGS